MLHRLVIRIIFRFIVVLLGGKKISISFTKVRVPDMLMDILKKRRR